MCNGFIVTNRGDTNEYTPLYFSELQDADDYIVSTIAYAVKRAAATDISNMADRDVVKHLAEYGDCRVKYIPNRMACVDYLSSGEFQELNIYAMKNIVKL